MEKNERVTRFLRKVVEKLTPAVIEAFEKDESGHFELHYDKGEFRRAFRKPAKVAL